MNLSLDDARYPRHLNPPHILGSQYPSAHGDAIDEEADSDDDDHDGDDQGELSGLSDSIIQNDDSEEEDLSNFPHLFLEDSTDVSSLEDDNGGQMQASADEGQMEIDSEPFTSIFATMQELDDLIIGQPSTSQQSTKRQRTRGSYRPEANLGHTIDGECCSINSIF